MAQSFKDRLKNKVASAAMQATGDMGASAVSGFIVKRLIAKGSFKNVFGPDDKVEGFQIQVKNRLGVATIVGMAPVKIDGELFSKDILSIRKGDEIIAAEGISTEAPFAAGFGDEFVIFVEDDQGLESGKHAIDLGIDIAGAGMLQTQFEETLTGTGAPKRVKKTPDIESAPTDGDSGDFADIMKRTVEMAIEHVGKDKLAQNWKVVKGIVLDLKDGEKYGVAISSDGTTEFVAGQIDGDDVLKLIVGRADFHKMAHGELNPGLAFARGDVKVEGVSLLKLRGMDEVVTSIFRGYQAASGGLSFDEVEAVPMAGAFEGYLAMALMGFDRALKVTDKALGMIGRKYFYEKALNRIEHTWDIFDRQIRDNLSFGRAEEAVDEDDADEVAKVSEEEKIESPVDGLREKLKERLSRAEKNVGTAAAIAESDFPAGRFIISESLEAYEDSEQDRGFELKLKNRFASATITGVKNISLDDSICNIDDAQIKKARKSIPVSEISESKPLRFPFGGELLFRVKEPAGIQSGKHRISISTDIVGLGLIELKFEEELSS